MTRSNDLSVLNLADHDGRPIRLSIRQVVETARHGRAVQPLDESEDCQRALESAMRATEAWVAQRVEEVVQGDPRPIYGINTGFGALSGREAFGSRYHARLLSHNLLVSHASGAGEPLEEDVVRAGLLIRSHQLAQGKSGVRVGLVNRLIGLLNAGIYPIVPRMGSLGASGDLAPLAHLALILSRPPRPAAERDLPSDDRGVGEAWLPLDRSEVDLAAPEKSSGSESSLRQYHISEDWGSGEQRWWRKVDAEEAMSHAGGRLELQAKEGLALTNGATLSAAIAALASDDAARILDHAELALSMTLEALRGFRDPFLPEVHQARPFDGAAACAAQVMRYVDGSTLLDPASRDVDPRRIPPQDPYSVRCAPQVLGAARDALHYVQGCVETEINSAVDNPLIFLDLPRAYKTVSCGNFHGAPLAYALDLLKIVVTDSASISERRSFKMTDYKIAGESKEQSLPSFLIDSGPGLEGLNSGLMIAQYTAAALTSACKTLAHPDSVDSIPSSANQEDHVSMSMNAGLHARQIIDHAESVIAIELLMAAQALDFRQGQGRMGKGTAAAHATLRESVTFLDQDRSLAPDIRTIRFLMRSGILLERARAASDDAHAGY